MRREHCTWHYLGQFVWSPRCSPEDEFVLEGPENNPWQSNMKYCSFCGGLISWGPKQLNA